MDLKDKAIQEYQEQNRAAEQEAVNRAKQESVNKAAAAAMKFEEIFGFPPEKQDPETGNIESGGLVFRVAEFDYRTGIVVMLKCEQCGEEFYSDLWVTSLYDLGRMLSESVYHPYCPVHEIKSSEAVPAKLPSRADQLAQLIYELARGNDDEF